MCVSNCLFTPHAMIFQLYIGLHIHVDVHSARKEFDVLVSYYKQCISYIAQQKQ